MNQFFHWLIQNPWNLIFVGLAVLGFFLSVVFYRRSQKEKRLTYDIRTLRLIEDNVSAIEAVEIRYEGQRVQNLSLSEITIWNKGTETINNEDVAPKDPIEIVMKGVKLLRAELIHTKNPVNNFNIVPDLTNGEILVTFDYFDPEEGAVIQIYHTGTTDDDLMLKGTVKGIGQINKITKEEPYFTDTQATTEEEYLTDPQATTLSQKARDSVSNRLQTTWDRYIEAVHRFIALNISVIVGVAAVVFFLPKLRGADSAAILASKPPLFTGLVLLMVSLICLVIVRIWVQQFMEYEVMQPPDAIKKYFQGRIHFTQSYRLSERNYRWQYVAVRVITILAPLSFLAGLSLSLLFLYRNLQ
jgi:hypothetical protein